MKLWIDDVRPAPEEDGYVWCKSVIDAKYMIETYSNYIGGFATEARDLIELIDIDHDAGSEYSKGGDFIRVLDWLEETGRNYPIRIHSQNTVGVQNMRRIIQRNGWKEVF